MTDQIGIIFDCDGTLLDSMGMWHSVDDRLAAIVGVEFTQADRDLMTRSTLWESSVFLHGVYGIGDSPEDVQDIIYEDMLHYYREDVRPKPGAVEFVKGLAELGVPMGIASSTSPALLRTGLDATGLSQYMKAIVSVDDLGTSKREPLIFDTVRQALGTPKRSTWGFEDALYAIETLKAAGYPTFAVYDSEIAGSPSALESAADGFIMSFADFSAGEFMDFAQRVMGNDRQR